MMFLLPHQYAWAMVANYDVHDTDHHIMQANKSHFGHHEHHDNLNNAKANLAIDSNLSDLGDGVKFQSPDSSGKQSHHTHVHYGFCHLSCGEVSSYSLPVFEATIVQFLNQYSLVYRSPTSSTLDRPKWLQPI